jgi:hypothetical protein
MGIKPRLSRHRFLRGPWLLQAQQQSPPAELWKLSRGLLALVGKARGLRERTRAVRNELTLNLTDDVAEPKVQTQRRYVLGL